MMTQEDLLEEQNDPKFHNIPPKVKIQLNTRSVQALIDSGAEVCLIKSAVAEGIVQEEITAKNVSIQGAFSRNVTKPEKQVLIPFQIQELKF